jgi:hypothetical protein
MCNLHTLLKKKTWTLNIENWTAFSPVNPPARIRVKKSHISGFPSFEYYVLQVMRMKRDFMQFGLCECAYVFTMPAYNGKISFWKKIFSTFNILIVSPGIDPGYSWLPRQKIIMYNKFGLLLASENIEKFWALRWVGMWWPFVSVVLTVHFPIMWLGVRWEPGPPPPAVWTRVRLFKPAFWGLTLRYRNSCHMDLWSAQSSSKSINIIHQTAPSLS